MSDPPPSGPSSPPPSETTPPSLPTARTRARGWLRRGLFAVATLLAGALALVLLVVHNLDYPWLRQHVRELARANAGLDIDYGEVRLGMLSELAIDDLVVRSPVELRGFAPELLRIGRLRARWSRASLFGAGPPVRLVEVEHVALTVVVDEHGHSSFDAIPSAPKPVAEPATPLSERAEKLLHSQLPVSLVHVTDVSVALVRTEHGESVERDTLRGLALALDSTRRAGTAQLHVAVGSTQQPLMLELTRLRPDGHNGAATARAFVALSVTPTSAHLELDVQVVRQDLAPGLTVDRLAHVEAKAKFEPSAHRSELSLLQFEVGDGAATAEALVLLPDDAAPTVRHATGQLDAVHLLQLAPAGLVPLRLQRGQLHYRIDELALDHPDQTGALALEGELLAVELTLPQGTVAIDDAKLSLHAKPRANKLGVAGIVSLSRLRFAESDAGQLSSDGLRLNVDAERDARGALTGSASLQFALLQVTGASPLAAHQGKLEVRLRELRVDPAAPLSAQGDVALEAELARLELPGAPRIAASAIRVHAHAPLTGSTPLALDAKLAIEHLRVLPASGRALADAPVKLELALTDLLPELAQPARSTGVLQASLEAGALRSTLRASKIGDALDFQLSAHAAQLSELSPFLSADSARLTPVDKLSFTLQSDGRLERVSARDPLLQQHSELRLGGAAYDTLKTRSVALDLRSRGTSLRQDVHADLRVEGLVLDGHALGDDQLTLALALDRAKPSLHLELAVDRLPKLQLTADLALDRTARAVRYALTSSLSGLSPLAPLLSQLSALSGFDVSELALELTAQGHLTGVVHKVDARGNLELSPDLARSAGGRGESVLQVAGLHWAQGDQAVGVPAARWSTTLHSEGQQRTLASDLTADDVALGLGAHRIHVSGLRDQTSVTVTGDPLTGTLEHAQHVTIRAVKQHLVPMYTIGDLTATVSAKRAGDGFIKLSDFRIENRVGGTTLTAQGGFDLADDRQRLSLRTTLKQDLARLSNRRDQFTGQGQVSLDVAIASPDFHLFHTRTKLQLEAASIQLPSAQIAVASMDGEVPILSDWTVDATGIEFLHGKQVNPYAAQRFADQHPMLSHRSFVSIASITTPLVSIAPFAANLKVERNIISLSQVELGVRQGIITGNGIFEYNGAESKLEANVRASHVMSSHGEPFDGNAALVMDIRDRSIEGRADILRIGKRHLLDLLDLQDPRRTDPSMNQIRGALRFGYPDRVRIAFKQGFASAGVEMGGFARLLKINDIRGIPIGPLMEQVLSSLNPGEQP